MRFLLYTLAFFAFAGLFTAAKPGGPKGPVITFTEIFHDFKQIKQDEVVSYIFTYKNTGDQPLTITDIKIPCGCTTPEFSKEPLLPGKEAQVKVTFNPVGQERGEFRKALEVHSNMPGRAPMLLIKGEIVKGKINGKKKKK